MVYQLTITVSVLGGVVLAADVYPQAANYAEHWYHLQPAPPFINTGPDGAGVGQTAHAGLGKLGDFSISFQVLP